MVYEVFIWPQLVHANYFRVGPLGHLLIDDFKKVLISLLLKI